jgi:hypothetical protein
MNASKAKVNSSNLEQMELPHYLLPASPMTRVKLPVAGKSGMRQACNAW